MVYRKFLRLSSAAFVLIAFVGQQILRVTAAAQAPVSGAGSKPNIILIVGDDVGWGDLGAYMGGEGRGQATPSLDRMAKEGMTFYTFYGQPSCTPGRAAIITGRIPNGAA